MHKNKYKKLLISISLLLITFTSVSAKEPITRRIQELNNNKVSVWKTIIYPTKEAELSMHRHDNDRVVVALTDGLLKVTNDQNKVHYLKLKRGMSYFLKKDPINELHVDQNMTNHPISVVVIELK